MNTVPTTDVCVDCCIEKFDFEPEMGDDLEFGPGVCTGCGRTMTVFSVPTFPDLTQFP